MIAAGGETHDLPSTSEVLGKLADRQVLDEDTEQPLVERMREIQFFAAPNRSEPRLRHQEQHRLAAARPPAPPALPRGNSAVRNEIEENLIFPAVIRQPVAQGDRVGIVGARMAQKDARHASRLETPRAPESDYKDTCGRLSR